MSTRRPRTPWRGPLAAALSAALVLTGASASWGAPPPPPTPGTLESAGAGEHRVTLITGDTVIVGDAGGGRRTVSVVPAEGREDVTFQTTEVDGELFVIPSDTVPYLASARLDRRMFDVTGLIEDGYDKLETLPLIATYDDPAAMRTQSWPGATATRILPSIDGTALAADPAALADFWRALTPGDTGIADTSGGAPVLAGGISGLWLDGRVHATLEESVGQIGAPDAWSAGYTGEGVDVAVLDTGVDAAHPDLSDRIVSQQDFSESPSGTSDLHGHGTHVAATIAGSGAGSAGRERGVAYDADLLIGKVLSDEGYGYDSWIIAGMEWAAAQGADIVNMSLGGEPTDGTDPLSVALDRISAETGTLFVVAAGNEGAAETVGTPGAAAQALTVAAVDANGALADFSSRGPRAGDGVLKPDISAPGVDILAARAAGTAMGTPFDEFYTSASGTSMASPHVAGAAALLAQQRPELTGADLKQLLMSSAEPSSDLSVWEQGAGEVDVARALGQHVRASGAVDFARLSGDAPESRTISYRNDSATPVPLTLTLDMRDAGDPSARTDAFEAPPTVDVPAHGTVEVTVSVDASRLDRGDWSGVLVAADAAGEVVARTPVGAVRAGPRHLVTVTAIDFEGHATDAPVLTLFGDRRGTDWLQHIPSGERLELSVEEGTYLLHAILHHPDMQDERTAEIVDPELEITGDTSIVLDARTTREVRIVTPQPAQQQAVHSYYVHREFGNGRTVSHGVMSFGESETWVAPTEKVRDGAFEFSSRRQMVRPSALLEVRGFRGHPEVNLLPRSPVFERPRTLRLVAPGPEFAGVRGRAAVIEAPDPDAEVDLVAQAAAAGAAAVIFVRPADYSIRTVFQPEGDRDPIPAMVTTTRDGQRLLSLARTPGATVKLDLTRSSPYLYDVQQVSAGSIPDGIRFEVTKANSHRIRTTYAHTGGAAWTDEQRFTWRPWQTYAWNDDSRLVETPSTREEWVTAGDSLWQHRVASVHDAFNWGALAGGMTSLPRTYAPGHSEETWYGPVLRSAGVEGAPSTRTGDVMNLRLPEYVDSDGHYAIGETTSTSGRLLRGDAVLAELTSGVTDVTVDRDGGRYRLELSARRDDPEWRWSPAVDTTWTFRSDRPADGETDELPLLHVSYEPPADASGFAPRRSHTLPIRVTDPQGTAVKDARVRVWLSSDAGATWQEARTKGGKGVVKVTVPRGDGAVSIRVDASVGDDRRVQQTVIDAYGRE